MMKCEQPGRIDDIECIGYLMLELCSGLPWSSLSFEEILDRKSDTSTFHDVPKYIREFISLSRTYNYNEDPHYGRFKEVLK